MHRDIRGTASYLEAEALYQDLRRPGSGQISDAAEIEASIDGTHAVFVGTFFDRLEGVPPTRVCEIDLRSGDTRVLTFGPNTDRSPKYSNDGRQIAFLSDRHKGGDFQLHLLDLASGAVRPTQHVEGWVEYLHWSPSGKRVLLGVAGYGADVSSGQGAIASARAAEQTPSWMPDVGTGNESYRWRHAWVYDLDGERVHRVTEPGINVWDAVWCGDDALAVVASPGAEEGSWYNASVHLVDIAAGVNREVYQPRDQFGCLAAAPSGERVAIVESLSSDRGYVAGDLLLIDTASGVVERVQTNEVDIAHVEWRSEQQLLLAGHRGFETVVATYDAVSRLFSEVWCSCDLTATGTFIRVSGINPLGDCVLVGEGFTRAPEIAVIRRGDYRSVKSFDLGYADRAKAIGAVEQLSWSAPDGLEIQGWLLRPRGLGPYPVVMAVHGGPVWHWQPWWLGRRVHYLMLLKRGYAVFMPNPRGSTGRGQAFIRHVQGDMGGSDAHDCLSGLDYLVERSIVDPKRMGVTGVSYGGYMAAWLIAQDSRFAASVPVAPVTNWVTEHLLANIPTWVALFLADTYANPGGKYFERSPVNYAHQVKTPTLSICGALDRCTPPEHAMQFHNALLEHDVKSGLVTYPLEGHGVRKFPAIIDHAARIVSWIEEHMPAQGSCAGEVT